MAQLAMQLEVARKQGDGERMDRLFAQYRRGVGGAGEQPGASKPPSPSTTGSAAKDGEGPAGPSRTRTLEIQVGSMNEVATQVEFDEDYHLLWDGDAGSRYEPLHIRVR